MLFHNQFGLLQATERGHEVSQASNPTQLELLHKKHVTQKSDSTEKKQKQLFEKYGGEKHMKAPPKELLLAQVSDVETQSPNIFMLNAVLV